MQGECLFGTAERTPQKCTNTNHCDSFRQSFLHKVIQTYWPAYLGFLYRIHEECNSERGSGTEW